LTPKTPNIPIRFVFPFFIFSFLFFIFSIDYIIYNKGFFHVFTNTIWLGVFGIFGQISFLHNDSDFEKNVENYYIKLAKNIYNVKLTKMNGFWWVMLLGREEIQQRMTLPSIVGLCNFCRHKPKNDKIDDKYGLCKECLDKFKPEEKNKKEWSNFSQEEYNQLVKNLISVQLTDENKMYLASKQNLTLNDDKSPKEFDK